jgi:hypothetical protein
VRRGRLLARGARTGAREVRAIALRIHESSPTPPCPAARGLCHCQYLYSCTSKQVSRVPAREAGLCVAAKLLAP